MKHAYLLHTGYGKTKLCLDMIIKSKPKTLLISTKKIIETSWDAEIKKWYPGQLKYVGITGRIPESERAAMLNEDYDILGINTEMLDWYIRNTTSVKRKSYTKQGIKLHYDTDELINRFDMLIIDESTLFKNSQTGRFKMVKNWAHKIANVIILSATPTPKNIENLWSQIYLLDGGQRLGTSVTQFRNRFAIAVPLPNGHNKYVYSQEATDEVLNLIKDITTSKPKPDKPQFPEPIIKKILLKPDPATAEILNRFKSDFIIQLQGKELIAFSKQQLINKVNQIASGSVYHKDETLQINDLKFRAVQHIINTKPDPVLIMYTYVFDKDKLLTLPGARLLESPQDFEDWNANKIPVGIISPFGSGHGLNLQDSECKDIIWFSPIWDTEIWIQANARVVRRGQRYPITISVLLLKGSYDEYAFNLCQDKFKVQFNNLMKLR